ncbi:MAG: hypothetical protein HY903_15110 [Deltaproteobacteria bacterium]|nr:hypothetical protein [Deltaproteobacteria bacterium]
MNATPTLANDAGSESRLCDALQVGARFALVFVLPLYPLVPRFPLWGPFGTDDVIPVAVVALAAAALLGARRPAPLSPVLVALGLVAAVATLAALVSAGGLVAALVAAVRVAGRLALYGVVVLAITRLLAAGDRRRLLAMLATVAVLEGLVGVAAYAGKVQGPWQTGMLAYPAEQMPAHGRVRVQGTFGGEVPEGQLFLNRANFYSAYLVMGLAALGVFVDRRRRVRVIVGAAAIVAGVLVSFSRMSLLAALLAGAVLALLHRRTITFAVVVAVTAVALAVVTPLRDRFLEFGNDRLQQWRIAARVIAAHPALGVGDGRYLEEAYRLSAGIDVPETRTPHNSLLYAAASYGIPSGVALVGLYVTLIAVSAGAWRRRRTPAAAALVALVAAFLLHDVSNNLFFIPEVALAFWMAFAATSAEEA